jgi:hypothetical protein
MGVLSKLLCIGVLAVVPACLGDDPDLDQPADIGTISNGKLVHTVNDPADNPRPVIQPPKTRVKQTATDATKAPDIDTVDGPEDKPPLDDLTIAP